MRADRLISILLLLQIGRRVTAAELAERLEVSERTILRDMEALGAAGVPVVADRGAGGGWSLAHDYRTDLTGLNVDELRTLCFGKSSRLLRDLGLDRAADAAFVKLFASATSTSRRELDLTRERLHVDGAGWYESAEQFPLLRQVQQAAWTGVKVDMTYVRADGSTWAGRIDPLGLVAKGSVWYLVAARDGDIRSYRVSRIQEMQTTEVDCERPDGFNLASHWKQAAADFVATAPQYHVVLRANVDYAQRLRRSKFLRIKSESDPDDLGWSAMCVSFEDESEACDHLIRGGGNVEVIQPEELKVRLLTQAREIVGLYRGCLKS